MNQPKLQRNSKDEKLRTTSCGPRSPWRLLFLSPSTRRSSLADAQPDRAGRAPLAVVPGRPRDHAQHRFSAMCCTIPNLAGSCFERTSRGRRWGAAGRTICRSAKGRLSGVLLHGTVVGHQTGRTSTTKRSPAVQKPHRVRHQLRTASTGRSPF